MSGQGRGSSLIGVVILPENLSPRQAGKRHFSSWRSFAACVRAPATGQPTRGKRMSAVQHLLAFARPLAGRTRSVRRPFHPSVRTGPYRLPHAVRDRLIAALQPFRNRDSAYALALFIARFWSVPGRVSGSFPIDRRALVDHEGLELTEKRIRSAIRTLEAVGYLDRALASGSTYKPTEHGLRKKPIRYVFGSDYAPALIAANSRAAAARGRREGERRPIGPESSRQPSAVNFSGTKRPKSTSEADRTVIMGPLKGTAPRPGPSIGIPPKAFEPNPKLEAALERLKRAIGEAGRGWGRAVQDPEIAKVAALIETILGWKAEIWVTLIGIVVAAAVGSGSLGFSSTAGCRFSWIRPRHPGSTGS